MNAPRKERDGEAADRGFLWVGKIARPHGVHGELKVRLFFEESVALDSTERVTLRSPKGALRECAVEAVRGTRKAPILALVEVRSREDAEALRDYDVLVERSALPPLEPGEYYLADVVGCDVFVSDRRIARVVAVRPDPSVDTLVLEDEAGKRFEQPLLDHFVARVDVGGRRVELASEDGLID